MRLLVTSGGETNDAYECRLNLLPSPGSTAASQTSYITIDDVRQVCPWLESLQDDDYDEAGYAADLLSTRQYLDRTALRAWRSPTLSIPFINTGWIAQPFFGQGVYRSPATNQWLLQQLDANYLIVTPEVVQALAHLAAAKILRRNLSRNLNFVRYALDHETEAYSRMSGLVLELTTNGTGTVPNVVIPLSQVNILHN